MAGSAGDGTVTSTTYSGRPLPRPCSGRRGATVPSRSGARLAKPNSRRFARCVTATTIPAGELVEQCRRVLHRHPQP